MAFTLNTLSTIDNSAGAATNTFSNTFTLASGIEWLAFCIGAVRATGSTELSITSLTITDGSANVLDVTSSIIQRWEVPTATTWSIAIATVSPSAASPSALVAGTCTVDITYNVNVSTAGADMWIFQLDSGASASNPYRGMAGTGIFSGTASDPFTAFADLALENGSFAIAFALRNTGTMTVAGSSTGGAWTQQDDATFGTNRGSVQYKAVSADYTETALALNPSTAATHLGYFFWLKEINDPAITGVTTLPATPSEALTVAGTALDVANTGIRLRDVADTGNYETLTLSGITATSLTATMPAMLTEVPFTVGTSRSVEFVATLSGAPSGTAFAGSVDVASGWAVVELSSPNTTASESLAGNLPFTPIDLDQLYYNTSSGNISVDATGVVTAGPSYVAGTTFEFYGWDESAGSARWSGPYEAQLTDDGSVVVTATAGKGSVKLLQRMRRRRPD